MKWKREQRKNAAPPAPAPTSAPAPAPVPAPAAVDLSEMPEGLSKMEQVKWKRDHRAKQGAAATPATPAAPPAAAPAPAPPPPAIDLSKMPEGLSKMEREFFFFFSAFLFLVLCPS